MADLDDQLRRLADHRAERVPPVRAAEVMGGASGRGRAPVWWLAAAAVLAVLVGGAAWLIDSADDDNGADVAGDPTSTVAPSTTVPGSTTVPATTTVPGTSLPGTGPLVTATDGGIELFEEGGSELIPVGPTHLAFLAGDVLVHQAADAEGFGWGDGPVLAAFVGEPSGEVYLGDDADAGDFVTLLDASVVDGRPTALVSRRTGGGSPETADVRLLLVDLPGGDVTDLGRFGGWESGVVDARLADGAIVLLRSAEAQFWVEVIDYDGTTRWELEPWFDGPPTEIAVVDGAVWTIDPGWSDDLTTPVFTWDRYDLLTGEPLVGGSVALTPAEGFELLDGWCHRPFPLDDIGCGSAGGVVRVDLEDGIVESIDGTGEGLVTTPTAVSSTAEPTATGEAVTPHG